MKCMSGFSVMDGFSDGLYVSHNATSLFFAVMHLNHF